MDEFRPCILLCKRGCACLEGYVRDEQSGKCVLPQECPSADVVVKKEYQECEPACPIACDNYMNQPQACVKMCVAGRFCTNGHVRDTTSGQCVLPKDCP